MARKCPSLLRTKVINACLTIFSSSVSSGIGTSERTSCKSRVAALNRPDLSCGGRGQRSSSARSPQPRQSRSGVIQVHIARCSALRVSPR